MTTEQAEQHFENIDLKTMSAGGKLHFTQAEIKSSPADVLKKVCGIYKTVRPFLTLVGGLFFVPKKWRDTLTAYMALMDGICP